MLRVEVPGTPVRGQEWLLKGTCDPDATLRVTLQATGRDVETMRSGEIWTARLSDLPEGEIAIDLEAVARTGGRSTLSLSLTVDRQPPEILIRSPENGRSYREIPPLEYTTGAETVRFILDDQPVSKLDQAWNSLSDGDHELVIAAMDAAGNLQRESVSFAVDRLPPALFSAVIPPVINRSIQVFSGLREPGSTISVQAPAGVIVSEPAYPGNDDWQFAVSGLTEGHYEITLSGTDVAGNTSRETIRFAVDLTPPPLVVSLPEESVYNSQYVPVAMSGLGSQTVVLLNGKRQAVSVSDRIGPLVDGDYVLLVRTRDEVGNVATVRREFSVDTIPPAASLLEPADGDHTDLTPRVRFETEEGRIMLYLDGRPVYVRSGERLPQVSEGEHLLRLLVTDAAGNQGRSTATFHASGEAPRVTILSPPEGVLFDSTPALRYEVDRGEVTAALNGKPLELESGDFLPRLIPGVYRLKVTAVDSRGRTGTAETRFEVQAPRGEGPAPALTDFLRRYRTFSARLVSTPIESERLEESVLTIEGLQEVGETVYLEQWRDDNHNGIVDTGEPLLRQLRLIDGVMSQNGLLPADDSAVADGIIRTRLFFADDPPAVKQQGRYVLLVMGEFDIAEIPFQILPRQPM